MDGEILSQYDRQEDPYEIHIRKYLETHEDKWFNEIINDLKEELELLANNSTYLEIMYPEDSDDLMVEMMTCIYEYLERNSIRKYIHKEMLIRVAKKRIFRMVRETSMKGNIEQVPYHTIDQYVDTTFDLFEVIEVEIFLYWVNYIINKNWSQRYKDIITDIYFYNKTYNDLAHELNRSTNLIGIIKRRSISRVMFRFYNRNYEMHDDIPRYLEYLNSPFSLVSARDFIQF